MIAYGRGAARRAVDLLGGPGYVLLSTPRARADMPEVCDVAAQVIDVRAGLVDEIAGELLREVAEDRLVALGGGRVIDTAKALAAALGPGHRAMAIPTTLSGAEMTSLHRIARGAPAGSGRRRPAVVVNDPLVSASQPADQLAASALNALGHAVEGPCTRLANPVATLAAHEGARLLARAFPEEDSEPDRDALALGALLSGYVIGSTGYGLHHVVAQTAARVGGVPHAVANAALLPHTTRALARRFPERIAALDSALGRPTAALAAALAERAGASRLRDGGMARDAIRACADAAAERSDLEHAPPRAARAELVDLYERAY